MLRIYLTPDVVLESGPEVVGDAEVDADTDEINHVDAEHANKGLVLFLLPEGVAADGLLGEQ